MREPNKHIPLIEGGVYYMGASSSPDSIRILQIVDGLAQYEQLPGLRRDPRPGAMNINIMEHLIRRGTEMRIRNLDQYAKSEYALRSGVVGSLGEEIASLQRVLDGEAVKSLPRIECAALEGVVIVSSMCTGDPWKLIDAMTGGCCNSVCVEENEKVYRCTIFGSRGYRVLKESPYISVLRVEWDGEDVVPELEVRLSDLAILTYDSSHSPR